MLFAKLMWIVLRSPSQRGHTGVCMRMADEEGGLVLEAKTGSGTSSSKRSLSELGILGIDRADGGAQGLASSMLMAASYLQPFPDLLYFSSQNQTLQSARDCCRGERARRDDGRGGVGVRGRVVGTIVQLIVG